MKLMTRKNLLGIYELILAIGAIVEGIQMIMSSSGIYASYPEEWLTKVPFTSWVTPGIIAIVLFGLGNLAAATSTIIIKSDKAWVISSIMGVIFLLSLIAQIIVLGDCYLATIQLMILSIIQMALSLNVFLYFRKSKKYIRA